MCINIGGCTSFIGHCLILLDPCIKILSIPHSNKDELLSSNDDIEDYPAIDDNEIERDDDQGQSVYDILGLSDSEPG